MKSMKNTGRVTGILFLMLLVFGPFSMMYVPITLIVQDDATTTAINIMASEGLFRMGIASDTIVFLLEIGIIALLYILLKSMDKTLALVIVFFRLAMTIIQAVNLLNNMIVLSLLRGADYSAVFEADQLHALMMLFLDAHGWGVFIWQLFFGLHLLLLGYLLIRSDYFPIIMGILVMVGSVGYLGDSYTTILLARTPEMLSTAFGILLGIASIGELWFTLWILLRADNLSKAKSETVARPIA